MSDILRQTLASVIAELIRLEPANLVAARAGGVLDATPATVRRGRPQKLPSIVDEQIAARYAEGATLLDLAAEFKTTSVSARSAILRAGGVIRRKGIGHARSVTDHPAFAKIKAMWDAGQNMATIGAACGVSRERVRQILTKAGVHKTGDGRNLRPDEIEAVRRHFDKISQLSPPPGLVP